MGIDILVRNKVTVDMTIKEKYAASSNTMFNSILLKFSKNLIALLLRSAQIPDRIMMEIPCPTPNLEINSVMKIKENKLATRTATSKIYS